MPTILKTKNSVITTVAPTTLQQGELAVNITDKKMWVGNAATTPVQITGAGTTGTAAGSNTQVQYNSSGSFAGSANFVFDGTAGVSLGTGTAGAITPSIRLGNSGSSGGVVTATLSLGSFSTGYGSNLISSSDFSTSSASYLAFGTTPNGASGLSAPVERMRINSLGNLGLGTTAPSSISANYTTLDIRGSAGGGMLMGITGSTHTYMYTDAGGSNMFTNAAIPLQFGTNNAERMRITSTGDVGIGTSTVQYKLHVQSADVSSGILSSRSTAASYLTIGNVTDNNLALLYATGSDFQIRQRDGNANSKLTFWTQDSERMRIDSSGLVSIGTTSGAAGLTVYKYGSTWTGAGANTYSVPAGNVYMQMGGVGSQNNWFGFTGVYGTSTGSANILLQANINNTSQQAGNYIGSEATGSTTAALTFGRMIAGATVGGNASKSEAMRITSDGNLLVGDTTGLTARFSVTQTLTGERGIAIATPSGYNSGAFRSISAATASTGWYHLYGSSSSDAVVNIIVYGNGNIQNANNSYGAISDIKLKENIVDATSKLDDLMQVKVRNYNLKSDPSHKQIGVIAQELETVFPNLIEETQDRGENDELLGTTTKSVKYSVFVPMLIKAVQELKAELDSVKAELQTLKGN